MNRGWFAAGFVAFALMAGAGMLLSERANAGSGESATVRALTNSHALGPNPVVVELFTSQG